MHDKALADYRNEIDLCDREIAALLSRRFAIARLIGQGGLKKQIKDEAREQEVFRNIRQAAGAEFAENAAAVYIEIIRQSRKVQE